MLTRDRPTIWFLWILVGVNAFSITLLLAVLANFDYVPGSLAYYVDRLYINVLLFLVLCGITAVLVTHALRKTYGYGERQSNVNAFWIFVVLTASALLCALALFLAARPRPEAGLLALLPLPLALSAFSMALFCRRRETVCRRYMRQVQAANAVQLSDAEQRDLYRLYDGEAGFERAVRFRTGTHYFDGFRTSEYFQLQRWANRIEQILKRQPSRDLQKVLEEINQRSSYLGLSNEVRQRYDNLAAIDNLVRIDPNENQKLMA